jgi:hypothetical protein
LLKQLISSPHRVIVLFDGMKSARSSHEAARRLSSRDDASSEAISRIISIYFGQQKMFQLLIAIVQRSSFRFHFYLFIASPRFGVNKFMTRRVGARRLFLFSLKHCSCINMEVKTARFLEVSQYREHRKWHDWT